MSFLIVHHIFFVFDCTVHVHLFLDLFSGFELVEKSGAKADHLNPATVIAPVSAG
jgi:hypothetical protein